MLIRSGGNECWEHIVVIMKRKTIFFPD